MKIYHWLLALSLAGTAFSGYLSATKLFTTSCAFNEPCPYFIGYPACYFGFGLFLVLSICSISLFIKKRSLKGTLLFCTIMALLGVLFAGYFTVGELPKLGTCVMGFVFFVILFAMYLRTYKQYSYEVQI